MTRVNPLLQFLMAAMLSVVNPRRLVFPSVVSTTRVLFLQLVIQKAVILLNFLPSDIFYFKI